MRRDSIIQLTALVALLAFLGASIALTTQVSASVGRNRLVYADTAESGDPPQVALGIAMGAFRGVFVNFLWIRANQLKEEGKYFESVDLAKTITRLQPRFPKVWAFHAWNLAYNISVATQTPQERWQWVQSGIRLLRDEGIPANPSDLVLHKELAWIYLHKVQGIMDDAHRFYKKSLALEWSVLMGKPPQLPFGNRPADEASRIYIEKWLEPIAAAPATLDELYRQEPAARELVERLRSEAGLDLDMALLFRVEQLTAIIRAAQVINRSPDLSDDPLGRIMADPRFATAGKELIRYTRRKILVEDYHMEPDRMIRFTEKFGPLDWRHPAAHALYWAARGVEEAQRRVTEENRKDFDFTNTDRVVVQAIQELFRSGNLFFDPVNPDFYMTLVSVDFLDKYESYRREITERAGVFEDPTRTFTLYREGLENFYKDAIRYLYRRGDRAKAAEYYEKLRTAPWLNVNNPFKTQDLSRTLEEFVVREITDDDRITSPQVAMQEITGALESAYMEGLLAGNTEVFRSNFEYAALFHREYQKSQRFRTWVAGEQGRMGLPPFDLFAAQVFAGLIMAADIPQGPVMYQKAPPELQARAYIYLELNGMKDRLALSPEDAALPLDQRPPDFDTWFPPPPNLEQIRAQIQRTIRENREGRGSTDLK